MKTLLLLLGVSCVTNCFAQNIDIYKRKPWEDLKLRNRFRDQLQDNFPLKKDSIIIVPNTNNTDVSVLRLKLTKEYVGNNRNGANVYAMMPYNMPCIMPDSTFYSNMPVSGFNGKIVPKGR